VHLGESEVPPEEIYASYLRYARQTERLLEEAKSGH